MAHQSVAFGLLYVVHLVFSGISTRKIVPSIACHTSSPPDAEVNDAVGCVPELFLSEFAAILIFALAGCCLSAFSVTVRGPKSGRDSVKTSSTQISRPLP